MDVAHELASRIIDRDKQSLKIEDIELDNVRGGQSRQLIKQLNQQHGMHLTPPWSWSNGQRPVQKLDSINSQDYHFYQSNLQPQLSVRIDFKCSLKQSQYQLIEEYLNQKLRLSVGPLILIPQNEDQLIPAYPFVYSWKLSYSKDLITEVHLVTALSEHRQQSKLYGDLYNYIYQSDQIDSNSPQFSSGSNGSLSDASKRSSTSQPQIV
jgi:hypothetical protein